MSKTNHKPMVNPLLTFNRYGKQQLLPILIFEETIKLIKILSLMHKTALVVVLVLCSFSLNYRMVALKHTGNSYSQNGE